MRHVSVMKDEVFQYLDIHDGMRVIDATAGAGGHTAEMIKRVGATGRVCALDTDPDAIAWLENRFSDAVNSGILTVVQGNFRFLSKIIRDRFSYAIDRTLFDLGVSLDQLRASSRGFSFSDDQSFDMRLDGGAGGEYRIPALPAADVVNSSSVEELERIFRNFGDDPDARLHANALVDAREKEPITNSAACAQILWRATPRARRAKGSGSPHPATQALQALRIFVNDEYESIRHGVTAAHENLVKGGRCAVITFHSGEDRIVKHLFRHWHKAGSISLVIPRFLSVGSDERFQNPRARSAKLRAFQKK